ncbi:aldo-keto reductase, putative [Rhizoctonia solani AG-3 Rhs1AP]|uniref:Aldo-keto reductase, putative n=2 Tax=Rhizoctonia solani AG-3 TaxID=1086053 RepID=X8IWU1_9AGAM|nr:aldo-keto reductase, putative [Rhizoctonia solani AG-3 Rhs1AP]KEP45945.1 putative aldo-keto reductase [Rhizoctonia solani 123E]
MTTPTLLTRRIGQDNITAIEFEAMGIGGLDYGALGDDEARFKCLTGSSSWVVPTGAPPIFMAFIGKWFERTGKRDLPRFEGKVE